MQDMIGELWLQTCIAILSNKPIACAYLYNSTTTGYIQRFSISNDCSGTHSLCGLERQERSSWRATGPQTCIGGSLIWTWVHILQYIAICCSTTHDNQNSRNLWLHITPQLIALLTMMHCFMRTSWLATLHIAVSFQLIMYANITTT